MTTTVLGRYDAAAVRSLLEAAGVVRLLEEQRGFHAVEVAVDFAGRVLPHVQIFARKGGHRFLLFDACVGEAVVRPEVFRRCGYQVARPIELAVVHWVREEDPTREFPADRPPLPLQHHPGLGILRRAFRVVVYMATELGKDGVASVPKFFHDAVIFFRSRLFLFLDGHEQGRYEALARDLRGLSLGDASLALTGRCVRDTDGRIVEWTPGYQVFPVSDVLTAYFHSPQYITQVAESLSQCRFAWDPVALQHTREIINAAEHQ